jgi:hypothetical protein
MIALVAIVASLLWLAREPLLGFEPPPDEGWLRPALMGSLSVLGLLGGIVFGSIHRYWRERQEPVDRKALLEALSAPELWRSLLTAPLIFAGVYAASRTQPDWVVGFFFAFQSGFFSDAIMQGKSKSIVAAHEA